MPNKTNLETMIKIDEARFNSDPAYRKLITKTVEQFQNLDNSEAASNFSVVERVGFGFKGLFGTAKDKVTGIGNNLLARGLESDEKSLEELKEEITRREQEILEREERKEILRLKMQGR